MNVSKIVEKIKDIIDSLNFQLISIIFVIIITVAVFSSYTTAQTYKRAQLQQKNEELQEKHMAASEIDEVSAEAGDTQEVVVHIKGEVKNPNVYTLTNKDRVKDAIEKAGGFTEKADVNSVNLAEKLYDSEEITISAKESNQNQSAATSSKSNTKGEKPTTNNAPVNINTASKEQLMTLPGIGETYAQRIIEYRAKIGGFKSKEQIMQVKGIGESRYNDIKNRIIV